MSEPRVVRNEDQNRYEVWVGEQPAGFAVYRETGTRTVFVHTEIDENFGGQGLGSVLAAGALDEATERHRTIVPECPFIARYLRKHPDAAPDVEWPSTR
jgi:predicted GNAT family acetyltransferase